MEAEFSWAPSRQAFLRRIAISTTLTFAGLAALGLLVSLWFDAGILWVFPTSGILTIGFAVEDYQGWRNARLDRWSLSEGRLLHEGPEGMGMISLTDIRRVRVRFGTRVILYLADGTRVAMRYLPHPRETAAQIAALLPDSPPPAPSAT